MVPKDESEKYPSFLGLWLGPHRKPFQFSVCSASVQPCKALAVESSEHSVCVTGGMQHEDNIAMKVVLLLTTSHRRCRNYSSIFSLSCSQEGFAMQVCSNMLRTQPWRKQLFREAPAVFNTCRITSMRLVWKPIQSPLHDSASQEESDALHRQHALTKSMLQYSS